MKRTTTIALIAILISSGFAYSAEKTSSRKYIFLMPLYNMGSGAGFSISGYMTVIDQVVDVIKKETGVNSGVEFVGDAGMSFEELSNAVSSAFVKHGDFAFLSYNGYEMSLKKKLPVRPLVMPVLNNKPTYKWCLYSRKDSNYKSVKDLKGSRFSYAIAPDAREWKEFQLMGIKEPANEYFKMIDVDNFQSQFYAVIMNEADVSWAPEYAISLLALTDTRFKKLRSIACTGDYYFESMIVYKTSVDKEIVNTALDLFENFTKKKAFSKIPYYSLLKKGGLSFKRITDADIKALKDQTKKAGAWSKEYTEWKSARKKK